MAPGSAPSRSAASTAAAVSSGGLWNTPRITPIGTRERCPVRTPFAGPPYPAPRLSLRVFFDEALSPVEDLNVTVSVTVTEACAIFDRADLLSLTDVDTV